MPLELERYKMAGKNNHWRAVLCARVTKQRERRDVVRERERERGSR